MKNLCIITFTVLLFLYGCSNTKDVTNLEDNDRDLNNSRSTFVYNAIPENVNATISPEYSSAINNFSVSLLSEVYKQSEYNGKNLILSPYSLSRNLSVLAEGAKGTTRSELISLMGGDVVLKDATEALSKLLYADSSIIFQCADALWIDSARFTLDISFREKIVSKYGVEIANAELDAPADLINSWIYENTAGKIDDFVNNDDFNDTTAMILTNALFFEADWESPFDASQTKDQPFYTADGEISVKMMTSNYNHQTYLCDEFQNVRLNYGNDNKEFFYLDIYMPTELSLDEFLRLHIHDIVKEKEEYIYRELSMPKFDFSSDIDLIPALKNMGVNGIFNKEQMELTGITDNPMDTLWVKTIKQKSKIKADEEGTKAYTVSITGLGGGTGSAGTPDAISIDKPFIYFLRGGDGLILFAGIINDPNME